MKIKAFILATVIFAVALCVTYVAFPHYYLVLSDMTTNEEYAKYPIKIGDEFSITFIHSVNKTPVTDVYRIDSKNDIHNILCKYYGFGAGVQTELNDGEKLRYEKDAMVIENINKHFPYLLYAVKKNSTHHLKISDNDVFLPSLSEKPMKIVFKISHRIF